MKMARTAAVAKVEAPKISRNWRNQTVWYVNAHAPEKKSRTAGVAVLRRIKRERCYTLWSPSANCLGFAAVFLTGTRPPRTLGSPHECPSIVLFRALFAATFFGRNE